MSAASAATNYQSHAGGGGGGGGGGAPSMDGWVKSIDPRSGRTFYANQFTRKTQWDPPPGWIDREERRNGAGGRGRDDGSSSIRKPPSSRSLAAAVAAAKNGSAPSGFGASFARQGSSSFGGSTAETGRRPETTAAKKEEENPDDDLPSNWEVMHDPASGRPFYVDHARRITTWERPVASSSSATAGSSSPRGTASAGGGRRSSGMEGTRTGFGFVPGSGGGGRSTEEDRGSGGNRGRDPRRSGRTTKVSSVGGRSGATTIERSSSSISNGGDGGRGGGSAASSASMPRVGAGFGAAPSAAPPPAAVVPSLSHLQSAQTYTLNLQSTESEIDSSSYYYNRQTPRGLNDDPLPALDFSVRKVADESRLSCPNCDALFTLSKRRHHCRLCGDVFCDVCSSHRVELPLDGPQFERPVRICDLCHADVERGNYFSMRRYLTPLQLFDPAAEGAHADDYARNVAAALSALAGDLDAVLLDSSSFEEKITIPADVLVPAVAKHLVLKSTSDRAIRALSSLLALGNVVGDDSFAHAVYIQGGKKVVDDILTLLEWSGSESRTLAVQEQAARAIFYLSDPGVVANLVKATNGMRRSESMASLQNSGHGADGDESLDEEGPVDALDVHRTLRNMLDHATSSASPSLQRWAASSIRNLVAEDQRRACIAINDLASHFGEGAGKLRYESFTSQLVSTGGVMILCSLIGADDGDTRAHATAALSATLIATRTIDESLAMLAEVTGAPPPNDGGPRRDAEIVDAIVSGGGCGPLLSQLLLSADDTVAGMGCSFASSLVTPLLTDPTGGSSPPSDGGQDRLRAYRDAALSFANGEDGCLPALISLLRGPELGGGQARPTELRKCAMEALAAVALTVGCMMGDDGDGASASVEVRNAVQVLESEGAVQVAYAVLQSGSARSLVSSRDSPAGQLREASSVVLAGMARCSPDAVSYLRDRRGVSALLGAAGEEGMDKSSALRGEWAPRCLGLLDAASAIVTSAWTEAQRSEKGNGGRGRESVDEFGNVRMTPAEPRSDTALDLLLEAIDAGAVPTLSKIVSSKIEFHNRKKAHGAIRSKIASARLLSGLLEIAWGDRTGIGIERLYDAVDANAASSSPSPRGGFAANNLVTSTVSLLQSTANHAQHYIMTGGEAVEGGRSTGGDGEADQLPLMELNEAALLAVGSMCGARIGCVSGTVGPGVAMTSADFSVPPEDQFTRRRQEACTRTCELLISDDGRSNNAFLPSMLVGAYGEGSVVPALRLALSIAQHGPLVLHTKLARSGILIPTSDILRNALLDGERYTFSASLALVRFCGPHVTAESGESGGLHSARESIRFVTNVLTITEEGDAGDAQLKTLKELKVECIQTLEALSTNASLWSSLAKYALKPISQYLLDNGEWDDEDDPHRATLCAALTVVHRIIPLPSHAVLAARAGVGSALAQLVRGRTASDETRGRTAFDGRSGAMKARERGGRDRPASENDVQRLALEVLHSLSSHGEARRGDDNGSLGLIYCDAVGAACYALGNSSTAPSNTQPLPQGSSAPKAVTKLGLEILQYILSDFGFNFPAADTPNGNAEQSTPESVFVEAVSREPRFIHALCATMLLSDDSTESVVPLYGDPLLLYDGKCAGYRDPMQAAIATLFSVASLCSSVQSEAGRIFWETFLLEEDAARAERESQKATAAAACAVFLNILADEEQGLCVPNIPGNEQWYYDASLPAVRHRLLQGISANLAFSSRDLHAPSTAATFALILELNLPQTCLSLCRSSRLLDPAYHLIQRLIIAYPLDILPILVKDKESVLTLLHLLNLQVNGHLPSAQREEMSLFFAKALGDLSERGLLGPAIHRLQLRSQAIAALSSACLAGDAQGGGTNAHSTNQALSSDQESVSRLCLKSLVGVCSSEPLSGDGDHLISAEIVSLSPTEAKTLSSTLGKKISDMVLACFLERASAAERLGAEDKRVGGSITEFPEVKLLCSLASNQEALPYLCNSGGLEALSLVATEGELSAILAMHEACKGDPAAILHVDGHISVMDVLITDQTQDDLDSLSTKKHAVDLACLELLTTLCRTSTAGKNAISNTPQCKLVVEYASNAIRSLCNLDDSSSDGEAEHSDSDDAPQNATGEILPEGDPSKVTVDKSTPYEEPLFTDVTLELAAFSLLTELFYDKKPRQMLLSDKILFRTASKLASECFPANLQYAAVQFLAASAPFASKDKEGSHVSAESIALVFASLLKSEVSSSNGTDPQFSFGSSQTDNGPGRQALAAAASGIECVFDDVSPSAKTTVVQDISAHFIRVVDDVSAHVSNNSSRAANDDDGLLVCNLSILFLLIAGDYCARDDLLKPELMSAMIRLIMLIQKPELIRVDGRENGNEGLGHWKAAQTHCLQCLSFFMRNDVSEAWLGVSWNDLMKEAQMSLMAGPNFTGVSGVHSEMAEAGSGYHDIASSDTFASALHSIVDDVAAGAASVAARRILQQISCL